VRHVWKSSNREVPMVPNSLRTWFVIHFLADAIFALPLFLAPRWMLSLLGWPAVDPLATRLVAAALFGIGIQSLLGRDEGAAALRALLNLKIIWSAAATVGLVWSKAGGRSRARVGVRCDLRGLQRALGALPPAPARATGRSHGVMREVCGHNGSRPMSRSRSLRRADRMVPLVHAARGISARPARWRSPAACLSR
jgi:hypothetical protein